MYRTQCTNASVHYIYDAHVHQPIQSHLKDELLMKLQNKVILT